MDPDDIFVPQWGSTPIRSTPANDAPREEEEVAKVLLNETDDLIATVMIHKQTADLDLGIPLRQQGGELVLGEMTSHCILSSTHCRPTMTLLSINGCDCAGMSASEAQLLISSTVGELTIQAVHAQVLGWSGGEVVSNNNSRALVATTAAPHNATTISTALVVPAQTNPTTTTNTPPKPEEPKRVHVVVQKSSKRSAVGLTIGNEIVEGLTSYPVIVRVEGLCANTALKVGMRIWSVNGLRCYTKEDTLTKLKRAKTTCHIEAVEVENHNGSDEGETAAEAPRRRGMARSLSPKKWLPRFHKKSNNEAELVPAETGESA